jgi:hypothetical protein
VRIFHAELNLLREMDLLRSPKRHVDVKSEVKALLPRVSSEAVEVYFAERVRLFNLSDANCAEFDPNKIIGIDSLLAREIYNTECRVVGRSGLGEHVIQLG